MFPFCHNIMFYPHSSWSPYLFLWLSVNCTAFFADFAYILYCSIESLLGHCFESHINSIFFNPHCNASFIPFAVKYKAICWGWDVIIFIITETRLDSIHTVLMDLACQPSEWKSFVLALLSYCTVIDHFSLKLLQLWVIHMRVFPCLPLHPAHMWAKSSSSASKLYPMAVHLCIVISTAFTQMQVTNISYLN